MATSGPRIPLLARGLRAYLRSELRGSNRLTNALARRFTSLHHVPVRVGDGIVHVDLRDPLGQLFLQRSPWPASPLEPDEQAIMRGLIEPGSVVFDIGAYIGLHTVLLSQLVGPRGTVHVFEANPRRHDLLARTVSGCGNATLHRFGLSDREGQMALYVPVEDEATSSLSDWTEGEFGAVQRVQSETRRLDPLIDSGALPRPAFVKVDVEGAERLVFEGARGLLDRPDAPVVMYEANRRAAAGFDEPIASSTEWLAALREPQYRFFHVQPHGSLEPIGPRLNRTHGHFNLVAVPASRAGRLGQGCL